MYSIRVMCFLMLVSSVWSDNEDYLAKARLWFNKVFNCPPSITRVGNKIVDCKNLLIFNDEFNTNQLDESKWFWEQYIPSSPDYEFVSYRKDDDVLFQADGSLIIRPKLITAKEELEKKMLDLSDGCTRQRSSCMAEKFVMHNPIISGRLVSKFTFAYGEIYITAVLPCGDWIYPEIYLEGANNQKIFIAYVRGNKDLTDSSGNDIGCRRLFGGPVLSDTEPDRSENLKSHSETYCLCGNLRTYRLSWTPEKIDLFLEGTNYGTIFADSINSSFFGNPPQQVRLVLGVGVGGITDFPDDYSSGKYDKPWRNRERSQIKKFYEKRHEWHHTWIVSNRTYSQLRVESVDIRSG